MAASPLNSGGGLPIMKADFAQFFVDPDTGRSLDLIVGHQEQGQVVEGKLVVADGEQCYPIVRGVPRFVPVEINAAGPAVDPTVRKTVESFSAKWTSREGKAFGQTRAGEEALEEQLYAILGVSGAGEFHSLMRDGLKILDAGCGNGAI